MTSEPSEELEDASMEDDNNGEPDTPSKRNRKKFHFSVDMDTQLIKFVMEENPYGTTGKDTVAAWEAVARRMDTVAGTVDMLPRTCRDRLERLLVYVETDSALLKPPTDHQTDPFVQERLELLQQMLVIRNDSSKKTGQPVVRLRVKPRMKMAEGKPPRRSQRYQNSINTHHANGTLPYILPARVSASGDQLVYTYAATTVDANSVDPDMRVAALGIAEAIPHDGDEAHPEGSQTTSSNRAFHMRHTTGSLDSQERSLLAELIECRRMDHEQRKEELEVRRHEAEVQKMKLELEAKQWEADRKERDTRLALEGEERKLVLQFMRRTLIPNGTAEPPF